MAIFIGLDAGTSKLAAEANVSPPEEKRNAD
jgi:hypothetical protein